MSDKEAKTLDVWLYGQFRNLAPQHGATDDSVLHISLRNGDVIEDIVRRLGIDPAQVRHLFLNHQYSTLKRKVKPGDRLAVFGVDMALLYRQYFPKIEDEGKLIQVQVKLYAALRQYHRPRIRLNEGQIVSLPEGSTVRRLIAKLDIPADAVKMVFVHGKSVQEDHILSDGDEIGIFPPVAGG